MKGNNIYQAISLKRRESIAFKLEFFYHLFLLLTSLRKSSWKQTDVVIKSLKLYEPRVII